MAALLSISLLACASKGVDHSAQADNTASSVEHTNDGFIKVPANGSTRVGTVSGLGKSHIELDWSNLSQLLKEKGPEFSNLDVFLLIDGLEERAIPSGVTRDRIEFTTPGGQHDVVVIFRDPVTHKAMHETSYFLLEAPKSQAVDPKTFENFTGEHAFALTLPAAFVQSSAIDPELVQRTVEIGYKKVIWTLTDQARPSTRALAEKYGLGLDVVGHLERSGRATSFSLYSPTGENLGEIDASEMRLQNDAAFSGNAFFWDNQFVSLASLIHHPSLSGSTLDFHYRSQDLVGNGVIPREVRHSNGVSFHRYYQVRFGETTINDEYINPNFTGWVESGLAATNPANVSVPRLKRAISSMQQYAEWVDQNRAVKDASGQLVGYWTSNPGSGADNSPRGGGNINKANFSHYGWVDLLAQQIMLYQDLQHLSSELGDWKKSLNYAQHAKQLKALLDGKYWNAEKGLYFDLAGDGKGHFTQDLSAATQASFWPLLTRGLSASQTDLFIKNWMTPDNFGGSFPAASLSSHHPEFHLDGGYWRGGRWPPSVVVLSRGFELLDRWDQAFIASRDFIARMSDVAHDHRKSENKFTVYEFYGMKKDGSGKEIPIVGVEGDHHTRDDFAGWGKTPLTYNLIRYVVGLRPVEPNLGGTGNDHKWLGELSNSKGSFFQHFTDLAHTPAQAREAAHGYLEWNLGFDWPTGESIRLKNFVYQGKTIAELSIKKQSLDHYELSVLSEVPVIVQVNRLFAHEGDQTPQAKPVLGAGFVRVGGGNKSMTAMVNLTHRAH